MDAPAGITELLAAAGRGEPDALDQVFALVYGELRRLAHRQIRHGVPGETIDTTALVHEAYLRLTRNQGLALRDRSHFFALSARSMRQILVDLARERTALKRGGGRPLEPLDEERIAVEERADEILGLDQALERLAAVDERLARLVELRFFAGLSVEEVAELLGVSDRTVKRDWRKARAFLHLEMTGRDGPA